jgi:hypothetical protein
VINAWWDHCLQKALSCHAKQQESKRLQDYWQALWWSPSLNPSTYQKNILSGTFIIVKFSLYVFFDIEETHVRAIMRMKLPTCKRIVKA